MTSPLSGATLTAQRANSRSRRYFLAFSRPNVIFTARINQTFSTLDNVTQFGWDTGSVTYTDVKAGMTVLIGSTAGASDIGALRVRRPLTGTLVYVAQVSGMALADNQYLTFVDNFPLEPKIPVVSDTLEYMDCDIPYSPEYSPTGGILRIGPPVRVLERTGSTVSVTLPAPGYYSPVGATISSYLWYFPGASSQSGELTSTPTVTYNTNGEFYYSCQIVDTANQSVTAYRKMMVNPFSVAIDAPRISGDVDACGFSCRVSGYRGEIGPKLTSVARSHNDGTTCYIGFAQAHNCQIGDIIRVSGMGRSDYNGDHAITFIYDSSTVAFPSTGADEGYTPDTGGTAYKITDFAIPEISYTPDRSLCVVYRQDYVGAARDTSYGPYGGAENISFVGWLDKQSLSIDPVTGTYSFTLDGPAAWMDKMPGSPMFVQDTTSASTAWHHIQTMDTDKALCQLVKWQSTLADICDMTLTGDTTRIYTANVNSSSLLQQINSLAGEKLLARICFDNLGCGFVTVNPSLRSATQKSANTILFDLASSDWIEQVDIERVTLKNSAQMELGGSSFDGAAEIQLYSRAPGNVLSTYGTPDAPASVLAVYSQATLNQLTGDMLAKSNSEYPSTAVKLYWPNEYAGYAMAQGWIVRMSISASDTPRGVTWTNKRLFIESVDYGFALETGAADTSLELAEETTGSAGITYFPPSQSDQNNEWTVPAPPGGLSIPPFNTWFPPFNYPPVPTTVGPCNSSGTNLFYFNFSPSTVEGTGTLSAYVYFPCKIRDNGTTSLGVNLQFFGDAESNFNVYAVDATKARILTAASISPTTDTIFNYNVAFTATAGGLNVAGFEIAVTAGGDDPVPGSGSITLFSAVQSFPSLTTGTMTATQAAANLIRVDYTVQSTGPVNYFNDKLCTMDINVNNPSGLPIIMSGSNYVYSNTGPGYWDITFSHAYSSLADLNFTLGSIAGSASQNYQLNWRIFAYALYNFSSTGRLYLSSAPLDPLNVRRIVIGPAVLFNVCSVS